MSAAMRRPAVLTTVCFLFVFALSLQAQVDRIDRERMRDVLRTVSSDVEKNFYDPNLKGLDWRALTEQARTKIDSAKSISEMVAAIYILTNKLDDSHTQFLPPGRAARPMFGFMAKPFGNEIRIYALQTKGPAAQAGLKVGDRIISVNGYTAERSTYDLMMFDFRLLRPRSELVIGYVRGNDPPQTTHVIAKIKKEVRVLDQDTIIWKLLSEWSDDESNYHWKLFEDDIAYWEVPTFNVERLSQTSQLEKAPRALLIDLRDNGGGSEDALLEFAGHFEPAATTMGNVMKRKKTEPLKIKPHSPSYSATPLVVLIDSGTGSAAEMLARHLQLSRKAIVVGDRSSGRVNDSLFYSEGTGAENVIPFGVQVSVGKVVFPNGEELEKHGVTPDVTCLPAEADLRDGKDPCLERAISLARKAVGLSEALPSLTQAQARGVASDMLQYRQEEYDHARP